MKKIIGSLILVTGIWVVTSCANKEDSVEQAQQQNINSAIDEKISVFLTEAADARMVDIEEGRLAKTRGTTSEIRQYGERMVNDQTKLLHEIRVLAASKNIALPNAMSNDKKNSLKNLHEEEGKDFDEKFIRTMIRDHKHDVHEFEKASDFKDKDIKRFASQYLPVIEAHLDQIENIKERPKSEGLSERAEGN
jgi:putative membrane protein